jgi:hypothetical protein
MKLTDERRALLLWATDCAEHVLPLFERERPDDDRPRRAIETARGWRDEISMAEVRRASLSAHAAARGRSDPAARAAARAAGQAVATAHVADHAAGGSAYALVAVAAAAGQDRVAAIERERAWQRRRLRARGASLEGIAGAIERAARLVPG